MNTKKVMSIVSIATIVFSQLIAFWQSDQQLVEQLENLEWSSSVPKSSWEYESFESCEDYETTLQQFLDDNKEFFERPYPVMYAIDDMMMEDAEMAEDESVAAPQVQARGWAIENEFSTTNIQVWWVDEPEILKTDGEYFYYYSQQLGQIYILEYGNGLSWWDLESALSSIEVPKSLNNIQLFLQDNTLTIIWNRWSQASWRGLLDNWQKTVVSIFDVSNPQNPKLDTFHDLDGYMQDSRMIDGELTLITGLGVNRWRWYEMDSNDEEVNLSTLRPTQRSVVYDTESSLDINGTAFPYSLTSTAADCESIQYLFPSKEILEQSQAYPTFTNVYTIDTWRTTTSPTLTALFGNTEQIHMSRKNLYLTSSQRLSSWSSCPINARCLFPRFGSNQTLIHKYELDGMEYDGSALIDGAPLPQRSMSESWDEEFRILTRQRSPQSATYLTILDDDLDLRGSIMNIEPWEEFKASRYIWDKLYLVTFEQIDPLFVIDLEDSRNPEILWELKIPWYSTYLHPYWWLEDGIQQLIGLGYDTILNQRGWVQTAGVKVDLYTIDYNQSPISIKQTHTLTMWEQGSWTEVADNPRAFVWNERTNTLLLPVVLSDAIKGQNCQVFYDANWMEETRECFETTREVTSFAWLKAVTIDAETWIEEESLIDLKPILDQIELDEDDEMYWAYREEQQLSPWMLRQLMMRAWFINNESYLFTNQSVTFSDWELKTESVLLKNWKSINSLNSLNKYCESISTESACSGECTWWVTSCSDQWEDIYSCRSTIMHNIAWWGWC